MMQTSNSLTTKKILSETLRIGFFIAVCILFLFPIYALLLAAFRPSQDLMRYGITFATLVPKDLILSNVLDLFGEAGISYRSWYFNSVFITVLQTGLSLFLSSMVGYGLAIYTFKGRNLITVLVIFIMMVPVQILILPLYRIMITIGFIDTYAGVVLPFVVHPLAVFFFRQYASGLPRDYIDAARIDGLWDFGIFFRIMAPLMKPAYGAMAILIGMFSWNSFLWPLIVLRTNMKFTLPIGLSTLLTPYGNNYDVLISGAAMAIIPLIIAFIFFQRFFMAGMTAGGIKG